jgi:hypothetical protein
MDTEESQSPAASPSTTTPAPKAAARKTASAKKSGAKKPAKKAKSSAGAKSPKRSPKKAAKKVAKKAKPAAVSAKKNPGGRPMLYPDKTILRLPKGSLKIINAKAKAADKSQGEFLRGILSRTTGIAA